MTTIDVIIPSWNGRALLGGCLDSLSAQTRRPDRIVVVDNGSSDGTAEWLGARWPEVRVMRLPENRGFAGSVQDGIDASDADLIALLNNDARPRQEWIEALQTAFIWGSVGACASVILRPDGAVESAGIGFSRWGVGFRLMEGWDHSEVPDDPQEVFGASGGAVMFRRTAVQEIGGFDRSFFAQDEDIDLAFRLRYAGYRCLLHPGAVVTHLGGQTLARDPSRSLYLAQRNLELVFWLNTPWWSWPSLGPIHAAYQIGSLLRHVLARRGPTVAAAKVAALRMLPSLWRRRPRPVEFSRSILPWWGDTHRVWNPISTVR